MAAIAAGLALLHCREKHRNRQHTMKILVLNAGSSSHKTCLYEIAETPPDAPPTPLWEGRIEWHDNSASLSVKNRQGAVLKERIQGSSREQVIQSLLRSAWDGDTRAVRSEADIDVVGHRVVHGGAHLVDPVAITPDVHAEIQSVSAFAPLHIQAELEGVNIIEKILGDVPQVAVFDTGFHQQMPAAATVYPGPYEWFKKGIRRYGFHGINHQYCTVRAGQLLGKNPKSLKLITCHLGNGCSISAVQNGRSIDTTMGFTPLDGLMMGTRSGAVDPGILTHLMHEDGLDGERIDELLNKHSGLLGISGLSSDMRDILAAIRQGHERAQLAFDIYIHRIRAAIGAMAAVLGGVDAVVFTAGVGENSPEVRSAACRGLEFAGLQLNYTANETPSLDQDIAAVDSTVRVLVIRAEEDWAIATECWQLTHSQRPQQASANRPASAVVRTQ
jgi:acetate kinase